MKGPARFGEKIVMHVAGKGGRAIAHTRRGATVLYVRSWDRDGAVHLSVETGRILDISFKHVG
jgi:uncharacterized protein YjhX (UPF0386 family)